MIDLYKYLQEEVGIVSVNIKPYNILLSAHGTLKVYHLDTSTKCDVEDSILGKYDMWDLATLIYYLCTRERLFREENDFSKIVFDR